MTTAQRKEPFNQVIHDKDGTPMNVGVVDGRLVPPFGEESIRKVRVLPLRDDDILLLGYPKTGCHWTFEIMNMIVGGKAKLTGPGKEGCFMELVSSEMLENWPGRRILNSHLWFDCLPKEITEKKTKIIFTVRNPKDTAVSFYHHYITLAYLFNYDGPFNSFFPMFLDGQVVYGSYFDYHQHWDKVFKDNPGLPVLIVSYEDMKEDLPREIRRMSKFIDVTLTDQQVEDIAKASGFDAMKAVFDKKNIVNGFIRKGLVGDWKNTLTPEQSEMIDLAVRETLAGTVFSSPRYSI